MELTRGAFAHTTDHWWWRPGWGPGARYFTFHLTFEDATTLHAAARAFHESVRGVAAVDVVPLEWLHLTMTGVGFIADVDERTLDAVADEVFAAASGLDTLPLRFDRAFVSPEGFGIASRPADWLDGLRRIQLDAVGTVRDTTHDSTFQPHVSLAYFSGSADLARLEDAASAVPGEVVVARPRLSLIELGRDDRVYTWRVVRQLILGT